MKLPIAAEILKNARDHAGSVDELLSYLKQAGVSQMHSSLALAEIRKCTLSESKAYVIHSKAWGIEREKVIEDLHEELYDQGNVEPRPRNLKPR